MISCRDSSTEVFAASREAIVLANEGPSERPEPNSLSDRRR